jgi:dCMP deaminase
MSKTEQVDYWDIRFIEMARLVASWSKDPSTKVGAVIVRPDKTVASLGFNGFPRHCDDNPELYQDRETKLSRIVHAEMNAILHSKEDLTGYSLYLWPASQAPCCCDRCAAHICQTGITRIVHVEGDDIDSQRWQKAFASSQKMFDETGIEVVSISAEDFQASQA